MPTCCGDFGGEGHPQTPSGNIHFVDTLVAHIPVTIIPVPVPVVVKPVLRKRSFLGRPQPKIIIHPRGNGRIGLGSYGIPPFVAKAFRHIYLPETTSVEKISHGLPTGITSLLRTILHDYLVLLCRFY